MRNRFKLGKRMFQIDLLEKHPPRVRIIEGDRVHEVRLEGKLNQGVGRIRMRERFLPYFVTVTPTAVWVTLDGVTHHFVKSKERSQAEEGHGGFTAPMPGRVIKVMVKAGECVEAGSVLVVMEAMKMEHRIEAPCAGKVSSLHCREGEVVAQGVALLEFDAD